MAVFWVNLPSEFSDQKTDLNDEMIETYMKQKIQRISALLAVGLFCVLGAFAQSQFADFRVHVTDESGKPMSGVYVRMLLNNIEVAADSTDSDGRVGFPTLAPGEYTLKASKDGYSDQELTNLQLSNGLNAEQELTFRVTKTKEVIITGVAKKGPISLVGSENSKSTKDLLTGGQRGIGALVATNSAVVSTSQGISVRGTRADGNGTYIDGVRAIGGGSVGTLGTEAVSVNIGGIPAMYGDLTGGAFSYTTRSASEKLITAVEAITSTYLDPYSSNSLEGFMSGPLWVKRYKEGGETKKYVKLGFMLDGTIGYYKDPSPTRTGVYVVKDDKLAQIENQPLIATSKGLVSSANFLTMDDIQHLKARPNSPLANGNFVGKLEFRPNKHITVTAYGSYYYSQGLSVNNNIMNLGANPRSDASTIRTYLQFTQNFKVNKNSNIKNAFYTIRADYQNSTSKTRDAEHLDNIFDYGYIGQFTSYPMPVFQYSNYDNQQNPNKEPRVVIDQNGKKVQLRNYWELAGYGDTLMTFTASDLNRIRANYTQYVYDYYQGRGFTVPNSTTLQNAQGLLNGYSPNPIYSIWTVPGTITSGWSKSQSERYSFFAMGQMQVKPKTIGGRERAPHDLQAGFYYEQQISRGYGLSASQLWILMNQLMNRHISELDKDHPILSYDANGVFTDTIRYNRLVNYGEQSHFDRAFRDELIARGAKDVYGKAVDERTYVDINSYKPGDFKLSMFTADELLNNGNGYVSYYGYDYLGNKVKGKPSIEAFLNNKDQRTIGAFQPVYVAAWLQDQFQFKDLVFRLGLRMERYDANQYVLKDQYSLYPIKTAGEVDYSKFPGFVKPTNIGDNFAVYVNDIKAPSKILGFRNGDKWYNADGSEQKSADFIANQTSNGKIAPYLVDPNQKDIKSTSLKDYAPAINMLPRIWFSFPLDPGKKTFYVSYDVLAQRPNSGASFLTIDELYYLKNRQGNTISNGSLQTRLKTDYEVGYKQIFGSKRNRALELSASYSEIRRDFGLYQINQGYPVTYVTYRNIDFATITGFRANFILQDIGPMTLSASYMLQFADGTGSNINSQQTLIASNQPNLRNVIPLGELDIRHNFKTSATWAWSGGRNPITRKNMYTGPVVGGKEIFKHTSFNIIGNAYSGAPYTPTTQAIQIGAVQRAQIKGVPFGARLPWQYTVDLNITKGFALKRETKNPLMINAFIWITNVLNTKNVNGVFPYTGAPQDDGFLNSAAGKQAVNGAISAQSYVDMYKLLLNSQTGNYGSPRQIRFGLRFTFN